MRIPTPAVPVFGRRLIGAVAVGACALVGVAATSGTSDASNGPTMDIQLLSFNDFHGNLEPPAGSSGRLTTGYTLPAGAKAPVAVTTDSLTLPGSAVSSTSRPTWPRRVRATRTPSRSPPVTSSGPRRCCRPPSTTSRPSRR